MADPAHNRKPHYRREQIATELRWRGEHRESITDILHWLGGTETTVGQAIGLIQETLGYSQDAAERAIAEHPDWARLVRMMGGMHGELLDDQPKF